MIILALDPSATTNLGFAVLCDSHLIFAGVALVASMVDVHAAVSQLVATHSTDVVCWESTVGGGFAVTRARISQVAGVIRLVAESHGLTTIEVNGPHAAKLVLGTGRPGKAMTKRWFKAEYYPDARTYGDISRGEDGKENVQHAADAAVIGLSVAMEEQ